MVCVCVCSLVFFTAISIHISFNVQLVCSYRTSESRGDMYKCLNISYPNVRFGHFSCCLLSLFSFLFDVTLNNCIFCTCKNIYVYSICLYVCNKQPLAYPCLKQQQQQHRPSITNDRKHRHVIARRVEHQFGIYCMDVAM